MFRFILSRYNLKSLVMMMVVFGLCTLVGVIWQDLLMLNLGVIDTVLILIWVAMIALLCWDVRFKADLTLFVCAATGGFVIEWWGTNTELWHYFTGERPALWILPAWPIAALSIDRIAFAFNRKLPQGGGYWTFLYWPVMVGFILWMTYFMWPSIDHSFSKLVLVLMLVVLVSGRSPREDLILFFAGSLLGFFLEFWGTRFYCWMYYTGQTPPAVAVFAHGFASISFLRMLNIIQWCLSKLSLDWSITSRLASEKVTQPSSQ